MKKKIVAILSIMLGLSIISFGFVCNYFIFFLEDFIFLFNSNIDLGIPFSFSWLSDLIKFSISLLCLVAVIVLNIVLIVILCKNNLQSIFQQLREKKTQQQLQKSKHKAEIAQQKLEDLENEQQKSTKQ